MKARLRLLAVLMFSMLSFTMVSCDECWDDYEDYDGDYDEDMSRVICGVWEGDFDGVDTEMEFSPDYRNAKWGYGTEFCGDDKFDFEWEIRYGILELTYRDAHDRDCCIGNYHITNKRFKGRLNNTDIHFSFKKTDKYYSFNPPFNERMGDYD